MQLPAYIPLSDFKDHPSGILGQAAQQLRELYERKLPVPPAILIPSSTLFQFQYAYLPTQTAEKLLKCYHSIFKGGYVAVYPSYIVKSGHETALEENISGDANFLESLTQLGKLHGLTPLLVVYQPQAIVSGIVRTQQLNTKKHQLLVEATYGVWPSEGQLVTDHFEVDLRTHHVTSRYIEHKPWQWKRILGQLKKVAVAQAKQDRPSLSDEQLSEITQACYRLKQTQMDQLVINWCLENTQFFITGYSVAQHQSHTDEKNLTPAIEPPKTATPVLLGQSVEPGKVSAICRVGKTTPPRQIKTGEILVMRHCTPKELPLLKKAAGVISEQRISSPLVIQTLHRYGIPTLAPAPYATHRLHTGQQVLLHTTRYKRGIVV